MRIRPAKLIICLVMAFALSNQQVFSDQKSDFLSRSAKVYIEPKQVLITDEGIFALVHEEILQVALISHDE